MRSDHEVSVRSRATRRISKMMLGVALLAVPTSVLIGEGVASATLVVNVPAQTTSPVLPSGSTTYNPVTLTGGAGTDYAQLTVTGLPPTASFSDTDGTNDCVLEVTGTATFTHATITTSGTPTATYTPTFTIKEYGGADTTCGGAVQSSQSNTGSLIVGAYTPTVAIVSVAADGAGTAIPNTSISSVLTAGSTVPTAITGTISYYVFGPQATPPSSCTTGGTFVGTSTVAGNAVYNSSLSFTPQAIGNYWWYASYSGDALNATESSICNSNSMFETVVGVGSPVVTWPSPSAISYGTPLGSSQLNATAAVSGTFSYSPAAGTILSAGQQTLATTFTPTDTVDYSPVTVTTPLAVSPAGLQITASSSTSAYGSTPAAATPTFAGFVNGDSAGSLSTQPTCVTTVTKTTAAGVHSGANTCSGAAGANYTISYVAGNVTITAPTVTPKTKTLVLKSGTKTSEKISCAAAVCKGTLSLTKGAVLGKKSFSLAAGKTATETITLNATGKKLLKNATAQHPIRVVLKTTVTGGKATSITVKIT